MKTPAGALRPAPEGQLPPTLLIDNQDALLNEPVYKVISQSNAMLLSTRCNLSPTATCVPSSRASITPRRSSLSSARHAGAEGRAFAVVPFIGGGSEEEGGRDAAGMIRLSAGRHVPPPGALHERGARATVGA